MGKHTFKTALNFEQVEAGSAEDNVLVITAEGDVKEVARSEFGGGSSQDLQSVLANGETAVDAAINLTSAYDTSRISMGSQGMSFVLDNDEINISNIDGLRFNGTTGGETYRNSLLPNKTVASTTNTMPDKNGQLATLDDITLQKVLDTGVYAEGSIQLASGNNLIEINPGDLSINMSGAPGEPYFTLSNTAFLFTTTFDKTIRLDFYRDSEGSVSFSYPDKPTGSYTLATTDDIAEASPDLQNVLNKGSFATIVGTNNTITLGSEGEVVFYLESLEAVPNNSSFSFHNTGLVIYSNIISDGRAVSFDLRSGDISFSKAFLTGQTKVKILDPLEGEEATLYFPAKTTGTYTLATLDDIKIGTTAPTSTSDIGEAKEIRVADGYIYWYVVGTGWLRSAGATF